MRYTLPAAAGSKNERVKHEMENKMKRFLSLALALVLVICLMPMPTASADSTRTIYFTNNSGWTGTIYAYAWYGSSTTVLGGWPGTAMTYVETNNMGQDIYSIEVSTSATKIIFNNNSQQTDDIVIGTDDGYYNGGTYTYSPTIYYVAGDVGLCGEAWSTSADAMTNNDGIREITFENVKAGSYGFKIVTDSDWNPQWPSSNYSLSVTTTLANVTIRFNASTHEITTDVTCAHGGTTTTNDTATCGATGTKTVTCSECGRTVSTETSPATGNHTYENGVCSGCSISCAHASHDTNGICTVCNSSVGHNFENGKCTVCGYERTVEAQIGTTEYENLTDALANAEENDTVMLLKPVAVDSLVLLDGIALDLAGCTLTVTSHVAAFAGNAIIDSVGGGLLAVDKNLVMLQEDNADYLPIWNGENGYVFIQCAKLNSGEYDKTEDSVTYKFLPSIGADAYKLLAAGAQTSGVQMKVVVSWARADGTIGSTVFTYSDNWMKEFYDRYNLETGIPESVFALTLSGISGKELTYEVYFESNTGVVLECKPAMAE